MTDACIHGVSATELRHETLGAALNHTASVCPAGVAVIARHQTASLTFGALLTAVSRVARGLLALDVEAGERVGIWSPNRLEWLIAQYAVAKIGAILVPLNPAYTRDELRQALNQVEVSVLLASPRFRDRNLVEELAEIAPELAGPRRSRSAAVPSLRDIVFLPSSFVDHGLDWHRLATLGDSVAPRLLDEREQDVREEHAALILFTSGTTGQPKGVTLSHRTLVNTGFSAGERLALTDSDRICLPVPLHHIFGCVLGGVAAVTHASALILPGETFDPNSVLAAIEAEQCTAIYGVPTMFATLLSANVNGRYRVDSLRTGMIAGAPCPVDLMEQVIGRLHVPEVTISYGMTETPPICQSSAGAPIEDRITTVGEVMPHMTCRIADPESGRTLPRGVAGELCARGYGVMMGYWNQPDATAAVIDPDGWMHTGDLATMRDDGHIQIVGRIKDLIIRGGEKIQPREIEDVLRGHSAVADAHVIGLPHAAYGEEVCACVTLREGATESPDDLRAYCRGRLALHKVPTHVRLMSTFPTTSTGKVQKGRLREALIAERSRPQASRAGIGELSHGVR